MSYQVIARKYRPQSFDQMVGQSHITQTLANALKNNRIPHALLFTGLRGTGKTSSARILAKALRCENPIEFKPCQVCQSCLEISSGRSVDVMEIDGASNNGVDAIRDLRENVMFMPSKGKYKIFIIDEVHMLSTSAFNALLKTLEEPPAHVIFMLATTEVHKIPQTILSRCQRFDFRRIPFKQVTDHLAEICKTEKISFEPAALWLIAKQGDGSMRDSLSLLDQVISFTEGQLTEQKVGEVLGLTERSLLFEVFDHILHRRDKEVISCLEKLSQHGQNPALFLEDLVKLTRHGLVLKTDETATLTIDLPDDEILQLKSQVQMVSDSELHMLFDMMMKATLDLNKSSDSFLVFEVCILRMAQAPRLLELRHLFKNTQPATEDLTGGKDVRINFAPKKEPAAPKLQEERRPAEVKTPKAQAPTPQPPRPTPAEVHRVETKPSGVNSAEARPVEVKPPEPTKVAIKLDSDSWLRFIEKSRKEDPILSAKIENLAFQHIEGQRISLVAPANLFFLAEQLENSEMRQKLQGLIDSEFGQGYTFEVTKGRTSSVGETAQALATKKQEQADVKMTEKWQTDPRVKMAQEVFKGEAKLVKKESL